MLMPFISPLCLAITTTLLYTTRAKNLTHRARGQDLDLFAVHVRYGDGVPHLGDGGQPPGLPDLALHAERVNDPLLAGADLVLPFGEEWPNMILNGSSVIS